MDEASQQVQSLGWHFEVISFWQQISWNYLYLCRKTLSHQRKREAKPDRKPLERISEARRVYWAQVKFGLELLAGEF